MANHKAAFSPWKTEAELCAAFSALAKEDGWTVYPECSGWDMLLVKDGEQLGVQAKLRPNIAVLGQAVSPLLRPWGTKEPGAEGPSGPSFIATLCPIRNSAFSEIAHLAGVTALTLMEGKRPHCWRIVPGLPQGEDVSSEHGADPFYWRIRRPWTPHYFEAPCWTPPYVPDLPAGVPAPVQLTRWKVQAVRLCVLLRAQGYLTSLDIKQTGLSPTYFTQNLLRPDGKIGKLFRYVARIGVRLPDEDHPDIAAAILSEGAFAVHPDVRQIEMEP